MSEIKTKESLGYAEIIESVRGFAQYLKEIRLPVSEDTAIFKVQAAAKALENLAADIQKEHGKDVENHETENKPGQ